MLPFLEDYQDRLVELHEDIKEAVAGLPLAALDWSPGPGMNSIAVLVAHTAGAERYWVGQIAGGDPVERERSAEFRTQGLDSEALLNLLDEALALSQSVLARLTVEDLSLTRPSHFEEQTTRVGWALLHALEHTAGHMGHIQITRQLWEGRSA